MISLDLLAALSGAGCDERAGSPARCGEEQAFLAAFAAALVSSAPMASSDARSGIPGDRPGREIPVDGLEWVLRGLGAPGRAHTGADGPDLVDQGSSDIPVAGIAGLRPVPLIAGPVAAAAGIGHPRSSGDIRIPPATAVVTDVEAIAPDPAGQDVVFRAETPPAGMPADESGSAEAPEQTNATEPAPAPEPAMSAEADGAPGGPVPAPDIREPVVGQAAQGSRSPRPSSSPIATPAPAATDAADIGSPAPAASRPGPAPEVAPATSRIDPVMASPSDAAAPTHSTSELGDAPEVSGQLAARIAEIAERLETQPPPRRMIVDLGELRVTVALRGDEVHASLAPLRGGEVPSGWQRDLSEALAARGFTLGDSDQQADGERRDRHANRREPQEATPPVRRRSPAATGVQL